MNGWCLFSGFDLNYDSILDQEIHLIATFQLHTLVGDGERNLALESETYDVQFVAKTLLINRFQKPWAQMPVNLNRSSDDLLGQFVFVHPQRLCASASKKLLSWTRKPLQHFLQDVVLLQPV